MKIRKCPKDKKTCYPTKEMARKGRMHIWSHDPHAKMEDLNIYRCDVCGFLHIGHKSYYDKVLARQSEKSLPQTEA